MPEFPVAELFGFPTDDTSDVARHFRDGQLCPFLDAPCVKKSEGMRLGTCSMRRRDGDPIVICPKRFAENGEELPGIIAREAEPPHELTVVPEVRVGRLGRMDWLLARLDDNGYPVGAIYGVEAQAVDTTGSLRPYVEAFLAGHDWQAIEHPHGINWRNVYKRIVPQLLAKGRLFEAQNSRLYVVMQDLLVNYLKTDMRIEAARPGENPNVIFYSFRLTPALGGARELQLVERFATTLRLIERAVGDVAGLPTHTQLARAVAARVREAGLHQTPTGVLAVERDTAGEEPVEEGDEAEG